MYLVRLIPMRFADDIVGPGLYTELQLCGGK